MRAREFRNEYESVAREAARRTGVDWRVILAQFAHETGYGTSALAGENNLAGIKFTNAAPRGAFPAYGHAGYDSLESFLADYERVMGLSYYSAVRSARGVESTIDALDESPWATDPAYGPKLRRVYASIFGESVGETGGGDRIQLPEGDAEVDGERLTIRASSADLLPYAAIAAAFVLLGAIRQE